MEAILTHFDSKVTPDLAATLNTLEASVEVMTTFRRDAEAELSGIGKKDTTRRARCIFAQAVTLGVIANRIYEQYGVLPRWCQSSASYIY